MNNQMMGKGMRQISKKMQMILIILGSLLLIFGGVLFVRNLISSKSPKNHKDSEEKTNTKKEVDLYTLISSLNITSLPSEYFGYFFTKDSYNREEISHQVKIYMAIRKIMAEDPDTYIDSTKKLTISEKVVEKAMKELFGENVELKHESLGGNSCSYSSFKYDKNQKEYIQMPGECEDEKTTSILMEQESFVNTEEKKEFTVRVAFVDFSYDRNTNQINYQYYKDVNKTSSVGVSEKYDLEPFKGLVNRYRFTFLKQENHYIFDKVEIINQ